MSGKGIPFLDQQLKVCPYGELPHRGSKPLVGGF